MLCLSQVITSQFNHVSTAYMGGAEGETLSHVVVNFTNTILGLTKQIDRLKSRLIFGFTWRDFHN
jgi:hypothetical protein